MQNLSLSNEISQNQLHFIWVHCRAGIYSDSNSTNILHCLKQAMERNGMKSALVSSIELHKQLCVTKRRFKIELEKIYRDVGPTMEISHRFGPTRRPFDDLKTYDSFSLNLNRSDLLIEFRPTWFNGEKQINNEEKDDHSVGQGMEALISKVRKSGEVHAVGSNSYYYYKFTGNRIIFEKIL